MAQDNSKRAKLLMNFAYLSREQIACLNPSSKYNWYTHVLILSVIQSVAL